MLLSDDTLIGVEYEDVYTLLFLRDEADRIIGFRQYSTSGTLLETYYYEFNLQGDVLALYDSSKAIVAKYAYDSWGKLLSVTNASGTAITAGGNVAIVNPIRYRGYYYDNETGFYYLNSRYYDPATRRFINADSFASTGQGLLGFNMYAYCLNNPVMYFDPTGKEPCQPSWYDEEKVKQQEEISERVAEYFCTGLPDIVDATQIVAHSMMIHCVTTGARPNNIPIGAWNKNVAAYVSELNTSSRFMSKWLGRISAVVAVGCLINTTSNTVQSGLDNNLSQMQIAGQVAVDVVVDGGSFVATTVLATKIGTAISPGVGTAIGFAAGAMIWVFVDLIEYPNGMTGRETMKSWCVQ